MSESKYPIVIKGWTIDESLTACKPITRCAVLTCKGGCCADGVWVDMGQADAILANSDLIMAYMPEERRNPDSWFAEHYNDDKAFPSGEYIGTTTVDDKSHPGGTTCVFLRPEDRYCAIQAASIASSRNPWELKPYYCCLFPLVDEYDSDTGSKSLVLDSDNSLFDHGGGCYEACTEVQSVFQVYAEETAMVLGLDGYRELCSRVGTIPRL